MKRKTLNKKLRAIFTKHAIKNGIKTHPQLENLLRRRKNEGKKLTNSEILELIKDHMAVYG